MASDELREAIASNRELVARAGELASLFERSEPQFREALETGEIELVADALGTDVPRLRELAAFFYATAADLAMSYPELARQADRWRTGGSDQFDF